MTPELSAWGLPGAECQEPLLAFLECDSGPIVRYAQERSINRRLFPVGPGRPYVKY